MVKVIDYNLRTSSEGKSFFSLVLQGGIEIIRSAVSVRATHSAKICTSQQLAKFHGSLFPVVREEVFNAVDRMSGKFGKNFT